MPIASRPEIKTAVTVSGFLCPVKSDLRFKERYTCLFIFNKQAARLVRDARTTTHKPTRLIHPREKEKRKTATLWTRYLAKTAFSQNLEEVKVVNMVDFLFNPSDVFASNAGSSLRKRRRDRVPESFIHANVIIVAVFVFC